MNYLHIDAFYIGILPPPLKISPFKINLSPGNKLFQQFKNIKYYFSRANHDCKSLHKMPCFPCKGAGYHQHTVKYTHISEQN